MKKFAYYSAATFWTMVALIVLTLVGKYLWDEVSSYTAAGLISYLIFNYFEKKEKEQK